MERQPNQYPMPGCSWERLKAIITAYYAAREAENTTASEIAEIAKTHRPVVSINNNFLRELGILRRDKNRITPLGVELARGLVSGHAALTQIALQDIVKENATLNKCVKTLKTREFMTLEEMKAQFIAFAGINENSKHLTYFKAIFDLLEESAIVQISGDTVLFNHMIEWEAENAPLSNLQWDHVRPAFTYSEPASPAPNNTRTPLPLGLGRIAYLELPHDWKRKELPKLIKILELTLGEEEPAEE